MVTKEDLMAFHSNKELQIVLAQVEIETKGDNQLDYWSTPPMTFGETRWDSARLIFQSNETPILNFEAQDLEMI